MTCFIPILSSKRNVSFVLDAEKTALKTLFDEKKANRSTLRVPYAKKYERFKLTRNFFSSN